VGRWLAAILRDDIGLRDQMARYVPTDDAGLPADENAVVAELCSLAAGRYFGFGYDVGTVTEFARWMRGLWVGRYPLGVIQIEGVIRAALGETEVDLSGIERPAVTKAQVVTASHISRIMKWDLSTVEQLVREAETGAARRGWNPRPAVA